MADVRKHFVVRLTGKDFEPMEIKDLEIVASFDAERKIAREKAAQFVAGFDDGTFQLVDFNGEPFIAQTRRVVDGVKPTRAKTATKPNGKGKKKTGLNPAAKLPKGGEVPPA